ncbi:MAG TPA: antibiotic biosynthesis monooxygenase [Candidatus Binataceae bacterium]|nr:antibiotic biosynthesis monooxygenase [Candidatus Binataceae bacterium]
MNSATHDRSPVSLVTTLKVRPDAVAEFSSWHATMMTAAAGREGFISAELNAAAGSTGSSQWTLSQHFRSAVAMEAWRSSPRHRELLEKARTLVDQNDAAAISEEQIAGDSVDGLVTEVVTTYVRPGKDSEYQRWAEKIHRAEAAFPGYRGGFLQPPASDRQHYWTTLVRFTTAEQLDAWLDSDVRRDLLREHAELVKTWEHHRMPSAFSGWFPSDPASGNSPPAWKQSMLVLLMLFPIVALEIHYLRPHLTAFNSAEATFIGNIISVVLLAWPAMPLLVRFMRWWILPAADRSKWIDGAGAALVTALYAIELVTFSYLL